MPDLTGRDEWERKMARELGRLLRRTSGNILELLGDPPLLENIPPSFWNEVGEETRAVIRKFFRSIYIQAAQEILDAQPIGVDWGLVNEAAAEWAKQSSFELIKGINETNLKVVRKAVADFYEKQQTIGEITEVMKKELKDQIGNAFGPVRAEMIASTEVTNAAVFGELRIINDLKAEGVDMISIWVTNRDEFVCAICEPLDTRPADRYDSNGSPYWTHPETNIEYGPGAAHPRCRCWRNHEMVLTKQVIGA